MKNINKLISVYFDNTISIDPITVVLKQTKTLYLHILSNKKYYIYDCISASINDTSFYQHSVCNIGKHLGKKITFDELNDKLKIMILNEIKH